jgi:hypothetical protein
MGIIKTIMIIEITIIKTNTKMMMTMMIIGENLEENNC